MERPPTIKERVAEARRFVGKELKMGARFQLLRLVNDLSDEEAEAALRFLEGESE